jgi:hypothetical protein
MDDINQYFGLPDRVSPSKIAIVDSKESRSVKRKTLFVSDHSSNKVVVVSSANTGSETSYIPRSYTSYWTAPS